MNIILNIYKEQSLKNVLELAQGDKVVINFNNPNSPLISLAEKLGYTYIVQNENIGNPQGLNKCLELCTEDLITVVSADFLINDGWKEQAKLLLANPEVGLVGYYWAQQLWDRSKHPHFFKGHPVNISGTIAFIPNKLFGCWTFRRSLIETVGKFCDKLSKYGQWDSEFQQRVKYYNYLCVYSSANSTHFGAGQDTPEYRQVKNEELSKAATNYNNALNTQPLTWFGK